MTPVEFHFVLPTGVPLANSLVQIQLSQSAYADAHDGIVLPREMSVTTDVDGKATLSLWPNNTLYYVTVQDTESEAGLAYKFIVPEVPLGTTVRLQDIVVPSPAPAIGYDDATLLLVLDAKANSRASELAAAASATAAAASAASISGAGLVAAMDAAIGSTSWKQSVAALADGTLLSNSPITGIDIRGTGVTVSVVGGVLVIDITGGGGETTPTNPAAPTTGSISLAGAGALYLVGAGLLNLA